MSEPLHSRAQCRCTSGTTGPTPLTPQRANLQRACHSAPCTAHMHRTSTPRRMHLAEAQQHAFGRQPLDLPRWRTSCRNEEAAGHLRSCTDPADARAPALAATHLGLLTCWSCRSSSTIVRQWHATARPAATLPAEQPVMVAGAARTQPARSLGHSSDSRNNGKGAGRMTSGRQEKTYDAAVDAAMHRGMLNMPQSMQQCTGTHVEDGPAIVCSAK